MHVDVFINLAVIPIESKPAAETKRSRFYSVIKNLSYQKLKKHIEHKGHPSVSKTQKKAWQRNAKKGKKNEEGALIYYIYFYLYANTIILLKEHLIISEIISTFVIDVCFRTVQQSFCQFIKGTKCSFQSLWQPPGSNILILPPVLPSHPPTLSVLPTEGRLASQGPDHDRMTILLKGMMGNKWKWQWCGSQLSRSCPRSSSSTNASKWRWIYPRFDPSLPVSHILSSSSSLTSALSHWPQISTYLSCFSLASRHTSVTPPFTTSQSKHWEQIPVKPLRFAILSGCWLILMIFYKFLWVS